MAEQCVKPPISRFECFGMAGRLSSNMGRDYSSSVRPYEFRGTEIDYSPSSHDRAFLLVAIFNPSWILERAIHPGMLLQPISCISTPIAWIITKGVFYHIFRASNDFIVSY